MMLTSNAALPTPEEILSGETQAGVARPSILREDEDDGTVQRATGVEPLSIQADLIAEPYVPSVAITAIAFKLARAEEDAAGAALMAAEERIMLARKNAAEARRTFQKAVEAEFLS